MAYRTIMLKCNADDIVEGVVSGAARPGELAERTSTAKQYKRHATAGGNAERLFFIEDQWQGKEVSDAYATTNRCFLIACKANDRVAARITDNSSAAGGDLSRGDPLESAGDGTLRKHSADSAGAVEYPEAIVAIADEAIDMSDSSGVHGEGLIAVVVQ